MIPRREFITLLGGAAVWPVGTRAEQKIPTVGFLGGVSPAVVERPLVAFRRSLTDAGLIEGRTVAIEYRWAEGQYDRLPALVSDLVHRDVAVIVSVGGVPPALAAKGGTSTIPIVFMIGSDPVELGLVASFNRPGGNATGINLFIAEIESKRLELLNKLVPAATGFAVLVNPATKDVQAQMHELESAAHVRNLRFEIMSANSDEQIEAAFTRLAELKIGALQVIADPFLYVRRNLIVSLAARHAIPTIYSLRGFAEAGGLVSYGTSLTDAYQLAGNYVARIIHGAKPAELPVVQPTKFELVVNLKCAKALALEVPPTLLATADEVIE